MLEVGSSSHPFPNCCCPVLHTACDNMEFMPSVSQARKPRCTEEEKPAGGNGHHGCSGTVAHTSWCSMTGPLQAPESGPFPIYSLTSEGSSSILPRVPVGFLSGEAARSV